MPAMTHTENVVSITGCDPADVPELDEFIRLAGYRIGELSQAECRTFYREAWKELRPATTAIRKGA